MSGLEERERAVELYFTTPMTTAQVVEHLGYPTRQCLEHWLRWIPGMPAIWPNPSSHWRHGEGQSNRCRVACRSGPPNSSARASARCMAGSGRTARAAWPRCSPKTGTPRRAISPLTPVAGRPQPMMMTRRLCAAGSRNRNRGNALMREVAEARRKRPRRRPAAPVEQGEDPVDRPVEAGVFARLDDMPARHRAERPPTTTTPGSALTSTPAPANLVDRDFTAERPNEKRPADITRDQGQGREGRAFRRRSTASMAGSSHTPPASAPTRSRPTGCRRKRPRRCRGTRVPWCIPTVAATAGGPDGSRSWNASG